MPRVLSDTDVADFRGRLCEAAERLFAEKGVDGATIRDLSQAVGVADAALYRYFGSKDAIAAELFARHYGALAQRIAEIGRGGYQAGVIYCCAAVFLA